MQKNGSVDLFVRCLRSFRRLRQLDPFRRKSVFALGLRKKNGVILALLFHHVLIRNDIAKSEKNLSHLPHVRLRLENERGKRLCLCRILRKDPADQIASHPGDHKGRRGCVIRLRGGILLKPVRQKAVHAVCKSADLHGLYRLGKRPRTHIQRRAAHASARTDQPRRHIAMVRTHVHHKGVLRDHGADRLHSFRKFR